ncbi:hypothetical protein KC310_25465, partial [Enterobacter hormaechei subsp. xiangfangensis]|uniref:hypothetical protein n=1 Tax=Enterobacter hormaechei TaxID=158836 RepID=UPI00287475E4
QFRPFGHNDERPVLVLDDFQTRFFALQRRLGSFLAVVLLPVGHDPAFLKRTQAPAAQKDNGQDRNRTLGREYHPVFHDGHQHALPDLAHILCRVVQLPAHIFQHGIQLVLKYAVQLASLTAQLLLRQALNSLALCEMLLL